MKTDTMISVAMGATLLVAATASQAAPMFDFRGFGGFTGPSEQVCAPPLDGCNIGFPPATPSSTAEYAILNPVDTETQAFQHFGWGTPAPPPAGTGQHSHLTSNAIDPTADPTAPSNFHQVITPGLSVRQNPIGGSTPDETIGPIVANDPDGEIIGWFDHHNNPLTSAEFGGDVLPAQVSFHYHLQIEDPDNPGLLFDSGEIFFVLDLWETLNQAPCPPSMGVVGPSGSVCDDRLRFGTGFPISPTIDIFDELLGHFDYMGDQYGVRVNAFWDDGQQTGVGWSTETGVTRFFVRAQITTVPEPGIIALMGLGLTGLAFMRGRRRRLT
jgi:hypothetical protein